MKLNYNHIFFLGIGGIGMSALARYFITEGKNVYGYDRSSGNITTQLSTLGAEIVFNDQVSALSQNFKNLSPEDVLIVRTPAVPANSDLYRFFQEKNYKIFKRSEILGWITEGKPTIAVAGTHGKTTTSSLIAHVLHSSGVRTSAFLGGIANNFGSNFLIAENSDWIVVEADEFDRSFLTLHPKIEVITSTDADHLDIYGDPEEFKNGFRSFIGNLTDGGKLIIHQQAYKNLGLSAPASTYCIDCNAMTVATEVQPSEGCFQFIVKKGLDERQFAIAMPGTHNVENALAAYLVAKEIGLSDQQISKAFMSFTGVERRFHYQLKTKKVIYLDDYAHHPSEINAVHTSLRMMYPDKKISVVFQPHLFSRTRDFLKDFAASLSQFDEIFLLDIYPARELPIPGITSENLLKEVGNPHKFLTDFDNVIKKVISREPEIVVTLGAGDIDQLISPMRDQLKIWAQ